MTLSIGSTIWYRDENVRKYVNSRSGPTEAGHWQLRVIDSETSRSWVLSGGRVKLPKSGDWPFEYARTEADRDLKIWATENRYKLAQGVERLLWGMNGKNPENLRKLVAVAHVLGYTPGPPK